MLGKPKHGWVEVTLNNKIVGTASYVDYVPGLIIDSCIQYLDAVKNEKYYNENLDINFDAEGYHFGCVKIGYDIFVYDDCGENPYIRIHDCLTENERPDIYVRKLLEEVVKDIESNLEDWILWDVFSEEDYEFSKRRLESYLNKARSFLKT